MEESQPTETHEFQEHIIHQEDLSSLSPPIFMTTTESLALSRTKSAVTGALMRLVQQKNELRE